MDIKKLLNQLFRELGKEIAQAIFEKLSAIESKVDTLGEKLMAFQQAVLDAFAKLDAATTAIGDRIKALTDQIGTGMSQADVDAVVTKLNAEADTLTGLAADPNNPVPPTT